MSIVSEITRINGNISDAYIQAQAKGAILPELQNSNNLASTIESIEQGKNTWKPEPDWWDIESILENNTEDYEGKMICLLSDSDVMSIINRLGADKIVTSDGGEYTDISETTFEHRWNIEHDKPCYLGYKTRYIIYYYSSSTVYFNGKLVDSTIYAILQNLNYSYNYAVVEKSIFNIYGLQSVVFKECSCSNVGLQYDFTNCKIANIEGLNYTDLKSLQYLNFFRFYNNEISKKLVEDCITEEFSSNISSANSLLNGATVYYVPYIDTSGLGNFLNCFNGSAIRSIESINFLSATNVSNMFLNCRYIININEILNIKISGINIKDCVLMNYDTLMRFIEALHDYSEDTENVHNIIIGPTLLAKLTDADKARIVRKGWTVS